jgi:hypothetical protein
MTEATEPGEAGVGSKGPGHLRAAAREARDDAAPIALAAAGILIALAIASGHAHWNLLGHRLWWIWLELAAPYLCLSALFETREQTDESTRLVEKWITEQNFATAIPNAPKITSGKVVARSNRVLAVA